MTRFIVTSKLFPSLSFFLFTPVITLYQSFPIWTQFRTRLNVKSFVCCYYELILHFECKSSVSASSRMVDEDANRLFLHWIRIFDSSHNSLHLFSMMTMLLFNFDTVYLATQHSTDTIEERRFCILSSQRNENEWDSRMYN